MKLVKRAMKELPKKFFSYFKTKENREFYFLFSLIMVLMTIPLPKYSLNSQFIFPFIFFWILLNTLKEKINLFKQNKLFFLLLSIPFWLHFLGLAYTSNFNEGVGEILKQLPFLIFPLVFSTIDVGFITRKKVFHFFPISVFIATVLAIIKAAFFLFNNLGSYFYYDQFDIFLNKHTTYFSLFIIISILMIIDDIIRNKKLKFNGIMLITFILSLYFLSVRISIITVAFVSFILVWKMPHKLKYLFLFLIPLLLLTVFYSPNFKKRFQPSNTETATIQDIDFRKLHWLSVIETIAETPIIGNGTGGHRYSLYKKYKKRELTAAYERNYNAHNQYLEVILDFGLLGFSFFSFYLGYFIYIAIKRKDILFLLIGCSFLVYFTTESILVRNSGIIVYSLLITMLYYIKSDILDISVK